MLSFRLFIEEESGFLLSSEVVLLGTISIFGLIVGLAEARNNVVQELGDLSQAIAWLSQDYSYTSVEDTNVPSSISTAGSIYEDDGVLDSQNPDTTVANGILVDEPAIVDDE